MVARHILGQKAAGTVLAKRLIPAEYIKGDRFSPEFVERRRLE
jgi:hypothetical protein